MKRRLSLIAIVTFLLLLPAQAALAFHCTVADKPDGAGVIEDPFGNNLKVAGESGKVVVTGGAFVEHGGEEVFVRGQPVPSAPQNVGTLPSEPHHNGSEDHGVQVVGS